MTASARKPVIFVKIASTPEEMAKRDKADDELFGRIIKDAGIKGAE